MTASVLIVDDEPLARKQLRDFVEDVPWLSCIGEAPDGGAAIELINSVQPDLVFLDVQMPGVSGTEVLRRIRHRPAVVFTTAYDRYAVTAFELQALDYLLKPFGRARFDAAVERARAALGDPATPWAGDRAGSAGPSRTVTRLFVRERGRIVPVQLKSVEWMEARDDYVALHTAGRRHLVHVSMNDLEAMLDPDRFVRIHRSYIVNLDYVSSLAPLESGRLEVELSTGVRLAASRSRSKGLRGLAL